MATRPFRDGRIREPIPMAEREAFDEDLGLELDVRMATYFTPDQLALFHREFLGWEAVSLVFAGQLLERADEPSP